jgi:FkbM family methyltransferase
MKEIKSIIRSVLLKARGSYTLNYVIALHLYKYLPQLFPSITLPNGIRLYINDYATLSINVPDMYERKEYFLYKDLIPSKGWIVADIGAYIGLFSLYASKNVSNNGLIISFEPNPLAYYWLVNNIKLNRAKNIIASPLALGNTLNEMHLYVAKENIGASSLIIDHITQNPAGRYTIAAEFAVPMITFDYFLKNSEKLIGRDIKVLDLVKIDVEGYELKVLEGSKNALKQRIVKRFVIEVHKDQVSTKEIIGYLKNYSFHIAGINSGRIKDIVYAKLS